MNLELINEIRLFLNRTLGPTAQVSTYTDKYVLRRFLDMYGFYGSSVMQRWNMPNVSLDDVKAALRVCA
jgi:hypothetical protein